jgi:nucleotide-binding universal stress UspA family protein
MIPAAYGAPFNVDELTANIESESKRLLRKLRKQAVKTGVPLTDEVRFGDIDAEILKSVAAQKADLVVMGTHGRRGFEHLVLGSVAERMLRRCPVPLLTIGPGRPRSGIRRILVTTDFSEGTADAIHYALSIAQERQAKVTLLHVVPDVAAGAGGKFRERFLQGVELELQRLVPEEALDWCDVETRINSGIAFEVIGKVLKSQKFDLLVMNIHGKGMLDRVLVGSTAERVVRTAAPVCPILLIPKLKKSQAAGRGKSVSGQTVTARRSEARRRVEKA